MANYKATFILDTRGREENADELVEGLKGELEGAGAEVTSAQNLGKHDFARAADRRYETGLYAQYKLTGDASMHKNVLEKLRLNKLVSHKIIQKI
tara:strand:- start:727 stop:1011 length:285 start_codon:yes stop_codon:yes gene_type:complete